MILTATNTNSAILNNMASTLAQIKMSGVPNIPLKIDRIDLGQNVELSWDSMTTTEWAGLSDPQWDSLGDVGTGGYAVEFYLDRPLCQNQDLGWDTLTACQSGKLSVSQWATLGVQNCDEVVFSDNDTASPERFTVANSGMVQYTPPDIGLNDNTTLSTTKSQPSYFVKVTNNAGLNQVVECKNSLNLLFQSVIVSSDDNPAYTINANQAIIVPKGERQVNLSVSGEHGYIIASYDIYIYLTIFNWKNLSEQQRFIQQQQVGNLVRNALYIDRYRGGTCTLINANLNGTNAKNFRPLKSDAVLKGMMRVDCVYWTAYDTTY